MTSEEKMPFPRAGHALTATQIVANLARLEGWKLSGDGPEVAIEKTFAFANYYQTMAFVNALAYIAHGLDHHPELTVHYRQCVVRWRTHTAKGITMLDFDCAARVDALVP